MYNKLVKLRNKKAFTLVEMLAVIAIVAVLVAIVVPIVGKSTTKARAATNAANLRAVESELATLKVSNPECFVAGTKTDANSIWGALKSGYIWFYNLVNGEGSSSLDFDTVPAEDGVLTFYTDNFNQKGDDSVSLSNVPTSVALSAETGMDVPDDGEMVILIIDNELRALYKSTDGKKYFDKDDFAEVAETGKYSGTGTSSGPSIGEKIDEAVDEIVTWIGKELCDAGQHKWVYDSDGKHKCDREGCPATGKCVDNKASDLDIWGLIGSDGKCDECEHGCMHVFKSGYCKYKCGTKCPECDAKGKTGGCPTCGLEHEHSWTNIGLSIRGYEHTCSGCGEVMYGHQWKFLSATKHRCQLCKEIEDHSGNSKCSCDATKVTTHSCDTYTYKETKKESRKNVDYCTCDHKKTDHYNDRGTRTYCKKCTSTTTWVAPSTQ